jgi:hypothetical protein
MIDGLKSILYCDAKIEAAGGTPARGTALGYIRAAILLGPSALLN